MKKFSQFLGEDYAANTPTLDEFQVAIEHKCQPFLKLVGGYDEATMDNAMYRGINRPTWQPTYKVRKNREPRNSGKELHDALNVALVKQTGIKHRSESIFVTGSKIDAVEYGSVHYIFPIGDFKFAYLDNVDDVTRHVWSKTHTQDGQLFKLLDELFGSHLVQLFETFGSDWMFPDMRDEKFDKFSKFMGDFHPMLYAGSSIMAAALTIEDEHAPEILAHNVSKLEFKTDNLLRAIHQGAELMIECDEYIAIPFAMFEDQ